MSLIKRTDLPAWYFHNPYVGTGYRAPRLAQYAFLSAFEWHNDTLNIYSHLLPGLLWLYNGLSCFSEEYYIHASPLIRVIIVSAYFSGAFMGFASAYAHTFHIVDRRWAAFSWKVDFAGIIAINLTHQILDSLILFKNPTSFLLLECIIAVLCLTDVIMEWTTVHWGLTYPLLSSTILTIPVALSGSPLAIYSLGCSAFVFIAGGAFFMGRAPERFWNPNGILDNFNSHVWHHLCIVGALTCAFQAIPLLRQT
jgi:predicted membrane channel-forming protein YqfA (hemolysin III family)